MITLFNRFMGQASKLSHQNSVVSCNNVARADYKFLLGSHAQAQDPMR